MFESEEGNKRIISAYFYHCNVYYPSDEAAFHSLMKSFACAKDPMLPRLAGLDSKVPLIAL